MYKLKLTVLQLKLLENIVVNPCDLGLGNVLKNMTPKAHAIKKNKFNFIKIGSFWDFPGGPMVKNLPANAGDMGSIPGLGRPTC